MIVFKTGENEGGGESVSVGIKVGSVEKRMREGRILIVDYGRSRTQWNDRYSIT